MKVVDDCTTSDADGLHAKDSSTHDGSPYMKKLFTQVGSDRKGDPTRARGDRLEHQGRGRPVAPRGGRRRAHRLLPDRATTATRRCRSRGRRSTAAASNKDADRRERQDRSATITGREIIERYVFGDTELGLPGPRAAGPDVQGPRRSPARLRARSSRSPTAKDQRKFWRTYYLERAVRLTGSAISNALGQLRSEHEPSGRARSTSTASAAACSATSPRRSSA